MQERLRNTSEMLSTMGKTTSKGKIQRVAPHDPSESSKIELGKIVDACETWTEQENAKTTGASCLCLCVCGVVCMSVYITI